MSGATTCLSCLGTRALSTRHSALITRYNRREVRHARRTGSSRLRRRALALPRQVDDGRGAELNRGPPARPARRPRLFDFRAAYIDPPRKAERLPPVRITFPDGTVTSSEQPDVHTVLSGALGRSATLTLTPPETPTLEEYWPDIEGLIHRETVTDEGMPQDTFFDLGPVHILTTSTINRLRELYPQGRFEVRRFRPNLVVETP